MPHQNTVFRQLTNRLPWGVLERLTAEHRADKGVRRLPTKEMLLTLLFGQFSGASSLRDLEALLETQDACRYHSRLPAVRRATLADAAASRPVAVFSGVLTALLSEIGRKARQEIGQCIRLIDATTMRLSPLTAEWSRFSASLCGVKAHLVLDPAAGCPVYACITPARVNDITTAKAMPIEPGATYVFDLGYYDYGWWAQLRDADCRIVTRLKRNTPLQLVETLPVADGAEHILSDQIGFLPARQSHSRRNPMAQIAVREVRVRIETGKVIRLLSNDLDAPASEIAALYKRRWAIELFFRWIKQTLKLRHFYGHSENAVRIQIIVALIAFVLLKLAHAAQCGIERGIESLTTFARLASAAILHRKRLERLRGRAGPGDHVPRQDNAQLVLTWI